jgi:hypothetical protein
MLAALFLGLITATFEPVTPDTTAQPSEVFVRDPSSQAQRGPGGHAWGLRPPAATDSDALPLVNARGDSVHTVLAIWRTAQGRAEIEPRPNGTHVRVRFRGLVPGGRYSVFVRQLAGRTGAVFTPLDVTGNADNFTADRLGRGGLALVTPLALAEGAQLALVYHSDGVDHRSSIGDPGITSHIQLITRVP